LQDVRDRWDTNKQLNSEDAIKRIIGTTMVKRNIVVKNSNDKYSFTKAYKLFIDFARDLLKPKQEIIEGNE